MRIEGKLKDSGSAFYRPDLTRKDFRTRGTRGKRRERNKCINGNGNLKVKYEYLDDAIAKLKGMRVDPTILTPERLGIYSCPVCFFFHIGNTPLMQDPLVTEWVFNLPSRYPELEIELGKRAYHNLVLENGSNPRKVHNVLYKRFKSAIRKSWSKC